MANINFPPYKSSIIELNGGINENVSSLELLAGELIDCKNYMISESTYGGYTSIKGYERFDPIVTPSLFESRLVTISGCTQDIVQGDTLTTTSASVTARMSHLMSGSFEDGDATIVVEALVGSGVMMPAETVSGSLGPIGIVKSFKSLIGGTYLYHSALDYSRTLVTEVPGEGPLLALHIFENKVYAFRKKVGAATVGFFVGSPTGWVEINTSASPIAYSSTQDFKFANNNFYATEGSEAMYWVDGVNKARAYNPTSGVTVIANSGMDPNDKPILIAAHNDYLFLAYRGGSLQHSVIGVPTDWSVPGEIGCGDNITNLVAGVKGSLLIFMENGIKVLSGVIASDFSLETFSRESGAKWNTARRAFGTVFSVDDRGLTTLEATDAYGDFTANSISQKFKKSLFQAPITNTVVSRDTNQYRIFYEGGAAIFVSFTGTELKGATTMEYNKTIRNITEGEIGGEALMLFCSDDGYAYRMDSGTSFDGIEIFCRMSTAYFHYNSPRNNKALKRATIEVRGGKEQSFATRVRFDYSEPDAATSIWNHATVYSDGVVASIWGTSLWGDFLWGKVSEATNRLHLYLQGIGTNWSYRIISREIYRPQHTIQNIITDYEILGRQN